MPTTGLTAVARRDSRRESQRAVTLGSVIGPRRRGDRSGPPLLLNPRQRPVYQEGESEEDDGQGDGDVEVALPRLQNRRRREHAGLATDVAAHHQGSPDLRDDGAEAGHAGGQQRQTCLAEQDEAELRPRRAEGMHLKPDARGHRLDGGEREAGHHGGGDDPLGKDHRRRCVEELPRAEGTLPPQQDGHEEAHHDGRQTHARVDEGDEHAAPGEARQRQEGPERHPDREREGRRRARDQEREPGDREHVGVPRRDEPDGAGDAVPDEPHPRSVGPGGSAAPPPDPPSGPAGRFVHGLMVGPGEAVLASPGGGGWKPYRRSTAWPSGLPSRSTNAWASVAWRDPWTTAAG